MAVICLVASTAMAEERAAIPTAGLTITKALAGKVDVTTVLAARVKDNRLVIVATSAFLGVDAGNDKIVVEYVMDSVVVLAEAKLSVKVEDKRYVVEAAIPLAALGLKIKEGLALRGDFGATHGDKSGADTALRTHWNNQATGIVNDEVFELKMEPANWGEITFP